MKRTTVTLFVKEHGECMEQCLGTDGEPVEGLWVKISRQINVMGVFEKSW